jgi:predicted deacetylase
MKMQSPFRPAVVHRSDGLGALKQALDNACAPVSVFVRDDDAGWGDDALLRLLDLMLEVDMPIDLAAIPLAVSEGLALELMRRQDASPGLIGIHQHGFAHLNHELVGRKSEFGEGRFWSWQRADLTAGRKVLKALFGERLDPIFTPPWNRCSAATPSLLAELGFGALSRSRSAPAQDALHELPVDVDWCRHARQALAVGAEDTAERAAAELAARVEAGGPVGLMLHHAAMDAASLRQLVPLLDSLRAHPNTRCLPMTVILGLDAKRPADTRSHRLSPELNA